MKVFWYIVAAGLAIYGLSVLFSFLGDAASQRSDAGIVAGAMVVIVGVAAAAALGLKIYKRIQGPDTTKDKK